MKMLRKNKFLPIAIAATISVSIFIGTEPAKASSLYPNPCNKLPNQSDGGLFNPFDTDSGWFDFNSGLGDKRNIPESSTVLTLLALGVVGTGVLLKRNRKIKFKKSMTLKFDRVDLSQQPKEVFQPKQTNLSAVVPPVDDAEDGEIQWLEFFKAS